MRPYWKLTSVALVATALAACTSTGDGGSTSGALAPSITAACELTNTAENATLYSGPCTVTQSERGSTTVFEVKMGDAAPFLFAGRRGDENWMHGPEEVVFTDLPNGAIFRWSNFVLVVAQ